MSLPALDTKPESLDLTCRGSTYFEPRHEKTGLRGFGPGPTLKWSLQPQKTARGLKLRIEEVEELCYLCSKNKG